VEIYTNNRSATKKICKLTNANDKKFKYTDMVENFVGEKQNTNSLEIEPQFTKMVRMESFDDSERKDEEIDNKPKK